MTKQAIKWWKSFSFWDKIRMAIGLLGVGSEFTLFLVESYPHWKVIAAILTGVSIVITFFFKDEDKNGVVDAFEENGSKKQ